jgi:two-component system chemotaxis response regulator CheY
MVVNNLKVLISDDSILVRKQISNMLNSMGCNDISYASNGKEAVKKYKEIMPDVVFMDIIMPEITGVEALKEITGFNPNAKVAIASSAVTQRYLKSAIEAGVYDFIQKPILPEDVNRVINKLLKDGE